MSSAQMVKQKKTSTMVVSFRAPRSLIDSLDKMADKEQRTRANMIFSILTKAVEEYQNSIPRAAAAPADWERFEV